MSSFIRIHIYSQDHYIEVIIAVMMKTMPSNKCYSHDSSHDHAHKHDNKQKHDHKHEHEPCHKHEWQS